MRQHTFVRAGSAALAATALALALPAIASAHVTIRPDSDAAGSWSKITVRVPNESDTAGTVKVQLDLPADAPFASVRVQPRPGWTAVVAREPLPEQVTLGDLTLDEAVTSVTWTADPGVRIGPDEFDEFAVSVGPLPEPGTYLFPATQTYDDGTVVAWSEPPADEEPEHPAPSIEVVEATGEDAHGSHGHDPEAGDDTGAAADADQGDAGSDSLARGVAAGGVVIGAAGVGFGAAALRRSRA